MTLSSSMCVSLIFIDVSSYLVLILLIVLLIIIIIIIIIIVKTLDHLYNDMDQAYKF